MPPPLPPSILSSTCQGRVSSGASLPPMILWYWWRCCVGLPQTGCDADVHKHNKVSLKNRLEVPIAEKRLHLDLFCRVLLDTSERKQNQPNRFRFWFQRPAAAAARCASAVWEFHLFTSTPLIHVQQLNVRIWSRLIGKSRCCTAAVYLQNTLQWRRRRDSEQRDWPITEQRGAGHWFLWRHGNDGGPERSTCSAKHASG